MSVTTHFKQRVEPLEPGEIELGQLGRAHLPAPDQGRELGDRQEGELLGGAGPPGRRSVSAGCRLVAPDAGRRARRCRKERQGRRHVVTDVDLAQVGKRPQAPRDRPGRAGALVLGQLEPGDPLGLLDHLGGDRAGLAGLRRQGAAKRGGADAEARKAFQ